MAALRSRCRHYVFILWFLVSFFLWSPYFCPEIPIFIAALNGIEQAIIFLPCDFYHHLLLLSFSSPNLSGQRLDVYHTSTHGVALARI